jgi:LmbE family N-acetylglucosaminyl deacetylase
LIVTTHPDDEWIFLGAVYPIYGAERGYTGTFAYVTSPNIGRVHEAINSVWAAGVTNMPFFLGFKDVYTTEAQWIKDKYYKQFSRMETALAKVNSASGSLSSFFGGGGS